MKATIVLAVLESNYVTPICGSRDLAIASTATSSVT